MFRRQIAGCLQESFEFQDSPLQIVTAMFRSALIAAAVCFVAPLASVQAQGLIWKLPEQDGEWIRYEGTVSQIEARPESAEGNLTIDWVKHVTIKSVGKEDADYRGETTPCRWIEIKVQTGKTSAAGVNTGSVGERIYKVLVPEKEIIGHWEDDAGLPVTHLPIVKGYRKTNDKDPTPREITTGMLQIYPVVAMIRHYKTMQPGDVEETVRVGQQDVPTKTLSGTVELESRRVRVLHETTLYRSEEMPFGLARWTVKMTEEVKGEVDQRSEFQLASEVTVDMTARQTGTDARSELVTP